MRYVLWVIFFQENEITSEDYYESYLWMEKEEDYEIS